MILNLLSLESKGCAILQYFPSNLENRRNNCKLVLMASRDYLNPIPKLDIYHTIYGDKPLSVHSYITELYNEKLYSHTDVAAFNISEEHSTFVSLLARLGHREFINKVENSSVKHILSTIFHKDNEFLINSYDQQMNYQLSTEDAILKRAILISHQERFESSDRGLNIEISHPSFHNIIELSAISCSITISVTIIYELFQKELFEIANPKVLSHLTIVSLIQPLKPLTIHEHAHFIRRHIIVHSANVSSSARSITHQCSFNLVIHQGELEEPLPVLNESIQGDISKMKQFIVIWTDPVRLSWNRVSRICTDFGGRLPVHSLEDPGYLSKIVLGEINPLYFKEVNVCPYYLLMCSFFMGLNLKQVSGK